MQNYEKILINTYFYKNNVSSTIAIVCKQGNVCTPRELGYRGYSLMEYKSGFRQDETTHKFVELTLKLQLKHI